MFWDKGYLPSQNIEALLAKEDAAVEDFLDDEDILQECKTHKKAIINYFTRTDTIRRLIELITTEPSEELPMAQRYRHPNMACEILTLGLPSMDEKILEDPESLNLLYSYLKNDPPLNPLLSSFFNKTFGMLFTKKAEQDWFLYQQMCLKLLEYIKSQNDFLHLICKHFSTPIIPDLLMQMIRDVEGGQLKRNLYEWLTEEKLVQRLIALLNKSEEIDKHINVSEFLCDLIQQGRFMRQNEHENDSFEPAFEGSNPILKAIESEESIEALLNMMLEKNAQETAIVSGVSIVLMLIKPIVLIDEANSDRTKFIHIREKEIHETILLTVIRIIKPRLKEFHEFLKTSPMKDDIKTTATELSPPLGRARLQICRLFTVLLQTGNEDIMNAICETEFFDTILTLFKQYCWNNFLHSEVEKCIQSIFYNKSSSNHRLYPMRDGSIHKDDGGFVKNNTDENCKLLFDLVSKLHDNDNNIVFSDDVEKSDLNVSIDNMSETDSQNIENSNNSDCNKATLRSSPNEELNDDIHGDTNDKDTVSSDFCPSLIQKHVIFKCKLISRLLDCWRLNTEMQLEKKRRRLGYMGYLIKILTHITCYISESEHFGALIENSFDDKTELEVWKSITNPIDGDLTKAISTQNKLLANCNAFESCDFNQHLPKDFLNESTWDYIMTTNVLNNLGPFNNSSQSFDTNQDDNIDDDYGNANGSHHSVFCKTALLAPQAFEITCNPWRNSDCYENITENSVKTKTATEVSWENDFGLDNFADFESHFNSFSNDLTHSIQLNVESDETKSSLQDKNETDADNDDEYKHKDNENISLGILEDASSADQTNNDNIDNESVNKSLTETSAKDADVKQEIDTLALTLSSVMDN